MLCAWPKSQGTFNYSQPFNTYGQPSELIWNLPPAHPQCLITTVTRTSLLFSPQLWYASPGKSSAELNVYIIHNHKHRVRQKTQTKPNHPKATRPHVAFQSQHCWDGLCWARSPSDSTGPGCNCRNTRSPLCPIQFVGFLFSQLISPCKSVPSCQQDKCGQVLSNC